ncbi:MarR family transcriptional regulator [Kocuria sediminis]|uniref:MarR family transcriptional regulator n=1 Tax=Kocuria sediminis TaxID=1038857 RepID=A0A6N8GNN3_9MICC|nr:MarR family transcriptional regulator [Kocuria sediminis]MUN64379.1 MarR family transcriptional regulator [Kocuria sediminis]
MQAEEGTTSTPGGAPPEPNAHRDRRGFDVLFLLQHFSTEAERYADQVRRRYGLAHKDVHALNEVMQANREGRPVRAGDIARRLVLSGSATTTVIKRLVSAGHIVRSIDPRDRREVSLRATEHAYRAGREMFAPMTEEVLAVLEDCGDDEIEVLRRRLPQLTDAVRRAGRRAAEGGPPAPAAATAVAATAAGTAAPAAGPSAAPG